MPDDGPAPNVDLNPREKFRVKVFNTIVDRLISEIDKRRRSCDNVNELFGFLTDRQISSSDIKQKATHLVEAYQCDLEEAFVDEIQLFLPLCASDMSVSLMLQNMIENKLVSSFPNVNIAFRIYLSILGTSCEGERSFSVLKRVKNYLRSSVDQAKLSALSLLSIESELLKNLDIDDIITDFAHKKSRKVTIV
jgi:hypothetical protein